MNAPPPVRRAPPLSLLLAIALSGVMAGLGAAALSWLIHGIEWLTFGHSEATTPIVTEGTTPLRRLMALTAGGVVAGVGWWALQRWGRPVVGITAAISADTPARRQPPLPEGIVHAVLQIIAVGSGGPIGREVAPRELGALFAGRISDVLRLDDDTRRVLMASGAAAGLAGVYHVPLAGAVFALEILLCAFSVRLAMIALSTSLIATLVARIEVSPHVFYTVVAVDASLDHVGWAAVVGLLLGVPAMLFRQAVAHVESRRVHGQAVLWALPLSFVLTGMTAIWLPEVLGNGRSIAQTAFSGTQMTLLPGFALLAAKTGVVLLSLRCGAFGGTLTPALAIGALAGVLTGMLAGQAGLPVDLPAMALAGAVAFLAVSMNAPLTAFALIIGFTGQAPSAHLAMTAAIVCAMLTAHLFSCMCRKS